MKKLLFVLLLALGPVFQPTVMAATTNAAKIYSVTSDYKNFAGNITFYLLWYDKNGKLVSSAVISGRCYIRYVGDSAEVTVEIDGGPYEGHYHGSFSAKGLYDRMVECTKNITHASTVKISFEKNELEE